MLALVSVAIIIAIGIEVLMFLGTCIVTSPLVISNQWLSVRFP